LQFLSIFSEKRYKKYTSGNPGRNLQQENRKVQLRCVSFSAVKNAPAYQSVMLPLAEKEGFEPAARALRTRGPCGPH
jgi:hypothetical protein